MLAPACVVPPIGQLRADAANDPRQLRRLPDSGVTKQVTGTYRYLINAGKTVQRILAHITRGGDAVSAFRVLIPKLVSISRCEGHA
jgi:hypothetical protein